MKRKTLIYLTVILLALTTHAQPGTIDPSFNPIDIASGNGVGPNGIVRTICIQNNGKIIIGGDFTFYNDTAKNYIVRLNTDGSLDPSFNQGSGTNGAVNSISVQSDSKIIIGGSFTSYNGNLTGGIIRLNSDGTIDNSFNQGTGADGIIWTTSIQNNGKIIIGGLFSTYNGTSRNGLARLNADGTIDNSFNTGTGVNNPVYTSSINSDGKVIIGGNFTSYNEIGRNGIARLNSDGSIDNTFNPGTGTTSPVRTTSIQSDGQLIIGGDFTSYNGSVRNRIARLNQNGSLDETFTTGVGANSNIFSSSIQSDGKIIIGGAFTSYNGTPINGIARLNVDGTIDLNFNPTSGATNPPGLVDITVYTTSIQGDGKIIIGGTFNKYNITKKNNITRVNSNGTLDISFNPVTGVDGIVYTSSIRNDGKIVIGGAFTSYNGALRNNIARLNANGTIDDSFNPGAGTDNDIVTTSIQNDGKIIIGGRFIRFNGAIRRFVTRLNADGSLDDTFNPSGTGAQNWVNSISIQDNGKIIIAGDLKNYNGINRYGIARLNSDGTLDTTFNPGTGLQSNESNNTGYIETTAIQNDGKIIIGGKFNFYNGTSRICIARINSDGILDQFFNTGTGVGIDTGVENRARVLVTSIQNDGKIIIGGYFHNYNGTTRKCVARLNTNGTLDITFNPETTEFREIRSTSVQSDGKIIIGGRLESPLETWRIVRLNTDGTRDYTFDTGIGTIKAIETTSILSDGKIIVGGNFTSYNGTAKCRLMRINGGVQLGNTDFKINNIVIFPNPSKGNFTINNYETSAVASIDINTILGKHIYSKAITPTENKIDISDEPKGIYLYKLTCQDGTLKNGKLILE